MDSAKRKTGINLLILFYCFIIYQNIWSLANFKVDILFESVLLGTLLYLIIGFLRRIEISRLIAIVFHASFQVFELISFLIVSPTKILKQLIPDISKNMLIFAKYFFIFIFIVITLINIAAIIYLIKNKDYFTKKEQY